MYSVDNKIIIHSNKIIHYKPSLWNNKIAVTIAFCIIHRLVVPIRKCSKKVLRFVFSGIVSRRLKFVVNKLRTINGVAIGGRQNTTISTITMNNVGDI